MGKTYRKIASERSKKKKMQKKIWKRFQLRNELKEVIQDYENKTEVSELSDEHFSADS
jgi:hypothetical protein